ncbi:Autolysin [Dactylella cylindrospora]|nr:Autolysin [Dactylella cylindrospora]
MRPLIPTAILIALSATLVNGNVAYEKRQEGPPDPTATGTTQYCSSYTVVEIGTTCDNIYSTWGVTPPQFLRWNPSVGPSCVLIVGNAYCIEAKNEPLPTITATTTKTTVGPPGPTQTGQSNLCDRWDLVSAGDSCGTFAAKYTGLTTALLYSWNPAIKSDCSNLWVGTYLCTRIKGWKPTTTSKPATTTSKGIATPTPTQPQMVAGCNKWYLVKAGENCATITSKTGATQAQLLSWNPSIKSDCSGLWSNVYVCVGTTKVTVTTKPPTTTKKTTTGNGITTPTPFQAGITKNCKRFKLVESGDTCANIASKNGITQAQFVSWNPAVRKDCSGLWAKYWVCVELLGTKTTTTKKKTTTKKPTPTGNGISTPSPIQTGMTKRCKTFRLVQKGDTCESIQKKYKITFKQLYSWNPAIGANCKSLWLKYHVCVAVY